MKLAWFTPFSTVSAIGHCSELILRELVKRADVTVYAADIREFAEARTLDFEIRLLWGADPQEIVESLKEFDSVVYNLGNHYEMHYRTFQVATRFPGIVILHDLVMHHLFMARYLIAAQDSAGYSAELEYAHGVPGRQLAEQILAGGAGDVFDSSTMLEFHMAKSAIRGSLGVIVHSEFARLALEPLAGAPVARIPFPTPDDVEDSLPRAGRALDVDGRLQLLTIGMVNRNKMIEEVIRAIGSSPRLRARVKYQVVGEHIRNVSYFSRLTAAIEELNLEGTVELLGYKDDALLRQYLRDADIVINLRNPHFGEGSWSLLETVFAGKPTVVWKHGFYDEFPDDAVAKISTLEELRLTLERLADSETERLGLGQRAAEYARRTFVTAEYCRRLLEFCSACQYNRPALEFTDFISARLIELFGTASVDAAAVDRIAAEVAGVVGVGSTGDITDPAGREAVRPVAREAAGVAD